LFSTDEGELHFPNLRLLLSVVRALPHSNAEAERVFSLIPDAKTKKRNNMSTKHLNLMENIYKNLNFEQKNELTLHAQDNDVQ